MFSLIFKGFWRLSFVICICFVEKRKLVFYIFVVISYEYRVIGDLRDVLVVFVVVFYFYFIEERGNRNLVWLVIKINVWELVLVVFDFKV